MDNSQEVLIKEKIDGVLKDKIENLMQKCGVDIEELETLKYLYLDHYHRCNQISFNFSK